MPASVTPAQNASNPAFSTPSDDRADVYALGKLLYEILTGDIPYPNMDFKNVPAKYVYIIRKATNDEPDRRYQTVGTMLDDFALAAKKHKSLAPVSQTLREMLQRLSATSKLNVKQLDQLAKMIEANVDDPQMLLRVVPRIPDHVLKWLLRKRTDMFMQVLEAYDAQVDEGVAFEYCDVVADFYENVFTLADDNAPRVLVLKRLPSLGAYNNRWHVGRTLARLLDGVSDPELVMAAREAICENTRIADWCKGYLSGIELPKAIRRAIDEMA
jgi:serine/threonine protein kinase